MFYPKLEASKGTFVIEYPPGQTQEPPPETSVEISYSKFTR